MRFRLVVVLEILGCWGIAAQKLDIKSQVLDADSHLKIPFVNLWFENFKKGASAANKEDQSFFCRSIAGRKSINLLNTKGSLLVGRYPAPAFKVTFTD